MNKYVVAILLGVSLLPKQAQAMDWGYGYSPWEGFYLGADTAYGYNTHTTEDNQFLTRHSVLLGILAGYNYPLDNDIIVGGEVDISYEVMFGGKKIENYPVLNKQYNTALRARLGYGFDQYLPYINAGFMLSNLFWSTNPESNHKIFGITFGGGLDYMLTENILVRGEYRFNYFGSDSRVGQLRNISAKNQELRLGIAYKF